jgi:hypothetical protein
LIALDVEDVLALQPDVVQQAVQQLVLYAVLDLKADGVAAAALVELFLDRLQQVLDFFLVDVEVAVARDAEGVGAHDLVAREEAPGEELDHVAQEDVAGLAAIRAGMWTTRGRMRGTG